MTCTQPHKSKKPGVPLLSAAVGSRPSGWPCRDDAERGVTTRDESSRPGGHGAGENSGLKRRAQRHLLLCVCVQVMNTGRGLLSRSGRDRTHGSGHRPRTAGELSDDVRTSVMAPELGEEFEGFAAQTVGAVDDEVAGLVDGQLGGGLAPGVVGVGSVGEEGGGAAAGGGEDVEDEVAGTAAGGGAHDEAAGAFDGGQAAHDAVVVVRP